MYVMNAINKWYSYLRVAVIRIDVHPVGKTKPTRHTFFMLGSCMTLDHMYLAQSTYNNLS
jgi:hypothetical protein